MNRLRPASECIMVHNQIFIQREDVLKKWEKIMQGVIKNDPFICGKFDRQLRDSIELWIASASATVRASSWITCETSFGDSLTPLMPHEIDRLHLNWWDAAYSRPLGELPQSILQDHIELGNIRKVEDVRFLYRHCVQIHTKMWNINKFHPGKWHPTFQQRAMNQIMFFDAVVRYLGWVLGENDQEHALYAYNVTVLDRLHKALDNASVFDMNILISSHNEQFNVRDHHRNEFNTS